MITHTNRAGQAATYLAMVEAFKCGPEPVCDETARRLAIAEAIAFSPDDFYLITGLGNAIEDYCADAGPHDYTTLKMGRLYDLVPRRIALLAVGCVGFFPRPIEGRTAWSNAPLDWSADTNLVDFADITFDGFELIRDA